MSDGRSSQLCFLCTDSGYHSGKRHRKGSHDKIALFVSPDKGLRAASSSGRRSLTDIKAGTKNWDLREGERGTGHTSSLKTRGSGRTDKTASTKSVYHCGLLKMSLYGPIHLNKTQNVLLVLGCSHLCSECFL